ncbi:ATP-binding protein [Vibrio tapetis]|uniref:histidine kinase n=1 Tax=Vibrio tapetis subsp. tapetis TaxID=1671868 RepID=A0A2N8ZKQ1_9VIBR|nr:ATP-binding protein [Vibrio tapetis]SON52490.1 putative Signal transduction histidine kinase [Vibrio tapetis subsp. tapetis]
MEKHLDKDVQDNLPHGDAIKRGNSIGLRLFFYTLLCGSMLAIAIASIQLYWDFKREEGLLAASLERIDTSLTSSVANSLWNLDEEQLQIQVNGIKNLASVEYVGVYSYHNGSLHVTVENGQSSRDNELSKSAELYHSDEKIGALVIEISYKAIYNRLTEKATVILLTQLFINLMVSFCVLFIVFHVMIKHINLISKFFQMRSVEGNGVNEQLNLARNVRHDEIDLLVSSINKLHEDIDYQLEKRKKMNVQLEFERDFTGVIIASSPSLICSLNEDFVIQLANTEVQNLLSMNEEDLLGKNWFDFFVNEDVSEDSRRDLLENIPTYEMVLTMNDPNGEERYLQWRLVQNRELQRVICFGVDVTELTNTENALISLNQKLEQKVQERTHSLEETNSELSLTLSQLEDTQESLIEAEKMASLGGLVGGVAHEINTPLGISVTATSFIEEKVKVLKVGFETGNLSKTQFSGALSSLAESTEILTANLSRAEQLVSSFKQVAVDQSSQSIYRFNVKDNLDKVLLSLSHELKVSQVQTHISCPDDINVDSYPSGYIQIYTNLITNSIRHGFDEWDGDRDIFFDIYAEGDHLVIHYRDSGKGIDAAVVKNIFEPFTTTKRGRGGSGLGANIVYNLVSQLLQGKIECLSGVDAGAQFRITVPLVLDIDASIEIG